MDIINLTVPNVSLCFLILSRDHKKIKIKRCNLYIHCLILCVPNITHNLSPTCELCLEHCITCAKFLAFDTPH